MYHTNMDTLAQKFIFLTERFTLDTGTEYLRDDRSVIMISFKNNRYIMTILGEYYIVTSDVNELIARLEDIQNGIKIEPNADALILRMMIKN